MKNKEVEKSMMNDKKEELKTAGNEPSDKTESTCVIQCMAIILKALFGMEAYVGQFLVVYHCLYPTLNGYEIIKGLLEKWRDFQVDLVDIGERCLLVISNNDKTFFIDKDDGRIFYPIWKECKAILPNVTGNYIARDHDNRVLNTWYDPEFKDKGWSHISFESGEHYRIIDKWCDYEDLKPYNPISSTEVTSYDNK